MYVEACKSREACLRMEAAEGEAPPEPPAFRACNWCGKVKPIADFGRNGNYKDGKDRVCKECRNRRVRERRAERAAIDQGVEKWRHDTRRCCKCVWYSANKNGQFCMIRTEVDRGPLCGTPVSPNWSCGLFARKMRRQG